MEMDDNVVANNEELVNKMAEILAEQPKEESHVELLAEQPKESVPEPHVEVLPEPSKEAVDEPHVELPKEETPKEDDEEIEKYLAKFKEVHSDILNYKNLVDDIKTSKHDQERIEKLTSVVMFSTGLLEKMTSIMVDMNNLFG
jgi:hypothetical protein